MVHPVFALYAAQYCSQVLPALPIVFLYQALHYTSDTYFFLIIASYFLKSIEITKPL